MIKDVLHQLLPQRVQLYEMKIFLALFYGLTQKEWTKNSLQRDQNRDTEFVLKNLLQSNALLEFKNSEKESENH